MLSVMELFKVVILGIVEGITEWLPISSTGHLILVDEFIKLKQSDAFMEMFNVVIQLGAILAVVVLYFKKLWPFQSKKSSPDNTIICKDKFILWFKIIVAVLPAMIVGLPLDDWMDEHLHNWLVVSLMLILYGIFFILIENYNKKRTPKITQLDALTFKDALLIGVFQVLSLVPGTSRSGATIIGGILLGASREVAAEFTFFLAIPVMFGASLLKLLKFGFAFTSAELIVLLVGMAVAFFVSILAIKFLMGYIKKHDFKVFGIYRIVLGVAVIAYFSLCS